MSASQREQICFSEIRTLVMNMWDSETLDYNIWISVAEGIG